VFPYSTADHALWLAVDAPLHSVYVAYQRDDALIVVNTNVCNGSRLAACATLHPSIAPTGAQPESVALDPLTQTIYTANQTDNDVSVIDASRCDAQVTSGCRQDAPAVPIEAGGLTAVRHNGLTAVGLATDPGVNTLYAVTTTSNAVSMINTNTCDSKALAGCGRTPPQVTSGAHPNAVAVDALTDSVYIANFGSNTKTGPGTVTVIDDATCNSTDSSGCAHRSTLHVPGGNAYDVAVDSTTDTLYVATLTSNGPNLVSVFNGATCNATNSSGCGQKPVTLSLGYSGGKFNDSALTLAINQATNTIYATNISGYTTDLTGQSLYVIDGATCDAANTAGCSHAPFAFTLGEEPWGIAVDQATDTIYVAIERGGDYAGSVAVINGASCNGSDTSGCARKPPMIAAGFGVTSLAINPATHILYTSNHEDASVSVINGATCSSLARTGCDQKPPKLPARNYPGPIAVDPAVGTAYVATLNGLAVIPLTRLRAGASQSRSHETGQVLKEASTWGLAAGGRRKRFSATPDRPAVGLSWTRFTNYP